MNRLVGLGVMAAGALSCGVATNTELPVSRVEASSTVALTSDEENDLRFIREEEKLARDVYRALEARWGAQVFSNIGASEQTHTDAVKGLLTTYGVSDPVLGRGAGEFENVSLQKLHDELVAEGTKSLVSAFTVGATIEDLDLADLARLTGRTTRPDVLAVYGNLARGSRNHLRAFVGQLTNQGATYEPKYLSRETFTAILSTPTERGR